MAYLSFANMGVMSVSSHIFIKYVPLLLICWSIPFACMGIFALKSPVITVLASCLILCIHVC